MTGPKGIILFARPQLAFLFVSR